VTERRLYRLPEPVLRVEARRVKNIDASVRELIDDMLRIMREEGGVGLAAPQAGESLRVITLVLPDETEMVMLNPELSKLRDEMAVSEACLSVPGYWGEINRYHQATIKGLDREGRSIKIRGTGRLAQAMQHEIDHLDGVLYIDHIQDPADLHRVEGAATSGD